MRNTGLELPVDEIMEIALRVMAKALDELVSACLDAEGNPKTPEKRDLMRARSMLPVGCKNTLIKD